MNCAEMIELLHEPERLNTATKNELGRIIREYPFLLLARVLYVLNLHVLHDINFRTELHTLSLLAPNRALLSDYFEQTSSIYPDTAIDSETDPFALIESFIATNETDEKEGLEFVAEYDYFSLLQEGVPLSELLNTATTSTAEEELIDSFLSRKERLVIPTRSQEPAAPLPKAESIEEAISDDTFFTETLAKIYIRQKKYDKALKIIKRISLKYPKKSAYFADQIRFLETLIINVKRDI